jgi:hypothetical protein
MDRGHLSQFFSGAACKNLSAVEADLFRSNQHEWNGVEALKKVFGDSTGRHRFPSSFLYLNDHDDEPVSADGFVTWYDAREHHPTRSEHRLYFPTTQATMCAAEGDVLIIGLRPDNSVLVIIAESDSTIASQIQWLFGFSGLTYPRFSVRSELECAQDRIEFASSIVLEKIGVQVETVENNYLDEMLRRFNGQLPGIRVFSEYTRETLADIDPRDDTDVALMAFVEREEILFRTLERHLIADRLQTGFADDTDDFKTYSISVQNHRKSRADASLINHLEMIFGICNIRYSSNEVTEHNKKSDFIFPGIIQYRDPAFDASRLTMMSVKRTCKDMWQRVLSEAERIPAKHLLTLEPGISENRTEQMRQSSLQLVVPTSLHATYRPEQQAWLLCLADFIRLLETRQS